MAEGKQQPLLAGQNSDENYTNIKESSPTISSTITVDQMRDDSVQIDGVKDFCREFYVESKKLWYLAGPAIFTSLCQYAIGATTQIFAGQLGTIQLATVSVENSVIAGFSYGLMLGLGSALETLCGQAYGAGKPEILGIYMQRSWIILNAVALVMMFTYIFGGSVLKLLGQTVAISTSAGRFAIWMIPQLFAYATSIPVAKFLQAQSKVMPMAWIALFAAIGHVFFNWLLIVKLGWGLAGAAVVLNGSWWFITVAQFLYVLWGSCDETWSGFSWKAFDNLKGFAGVSFTTAIMFCLETWYITALVIFAGFFEEAAASIDALSVCINILGWCNMISLGLNVAISIRVSNELGYTRPRTARFSVIVVVLTSLLIGFICMIVLLATRKQYPSFFTIDPQVMLLVDELTLLLGVSIIVTSFQFALSGVAIGGGWQTTVAYMNVGSYFLFGVPLSLLLGYKFDMGVKGIWYGMVSGVSMQCCLLLIMVCRINWSEEVYVAGERIKQWGGEKIVDKEDEERSSSLVVTPLF